MKENTKKGNTNAFEGAPIQEEEVSGNSFINDITTKLNDKSNMERDRRLKQLVTAMSDEEQMVCLRYMKPSNVGVAVFKMLVEQDQTIKGFMEFAKGVGK